MLKSIFSLPADLYKNRRLVMKLAKNDFKTRYAGSYFGTFWAFVQPVVTILVYWFVFSVGFRSNTDELGVPFVLYLVAGIVPWFFFSDALSGGTNSLLEYNYLVKKVVFNISVLPVVKIISALFVHGFFVLLAIILYICNGRFPDWYYLQILYYSACVFFLVLGLCYATSAIAVLFRDLNQIIGIGLQVGVWLTPIMWVSESQRLRITGSVHLLLRASHSVISQGSDSVSLTQACSGPLRVHFIGQTRITEGCRSFSYPDVQ